jgi:lipid II:glycine glycyltransferase (peptidoglycan interpeptide bridge formation enzyme)
MKDTAATVIVDVSPDENVIMNNLQKDARWGIRKSIKEGLIVEISDDWDSFYPIYLSTMKYSGIKPETKKHLIEHGKVLFLCKKNDIIIAGASLEIQNGLPYLSRNASLDDYKKYEPNNLLYWHCILWSKNQGYEKLNLGGWQINARGDEIGINKFKERWGKVVYYEKDYSLLRALGRKVVRNSKFFYNINKIKKCCNDIYITWIACNCWSLLGCLEKH